MFGPTSMTGAYALKKIAENEYESFENPEEQTPGAGISFGGTLLALCVNAAYQTIKVAPGEQYPTLYSVNGNYLGGARFGIPVRLSVSSLRDTRTFATRFIKMTQDISGKNRVCLTCTLDFIQPSQGPIVTKYSLAPKMKVTHHSKLLEVEELRKKQVAEGYADQKIMGIFNKFFSHQYYRRIAKLAPEGMLYHNWFGFRKGAKSSQDHLHVTERIELEWVHTRENLEYGSGQRSDDAVLPPTKEAAAAAYLAYEADGGLPAAGLWFQHLPRTVAGTMSALDFSLRFLERDLDPDAHFLHEMSTLFSDDQRTYAESRFWQEGPDGKLKLVVVMNQACILRPSAQAPQKGKL